VEAHQAVFRAQDDPSKVQVNITFNARSILEECYRIS